MVHVPLRPLDFPISPSDYAETRSEERLARDSVIASGQLGRMTPHPENLERHDQVLQGIRDSQEWPETGERMPFDFYASHSPSGRQEQVPVARDELVVRTAPPAGDPVPPGVADEHEHRSRCLALLARLGYRPRDERLPLLDPRTEVFRALPGKQWSPDLAAEHLATIRDAGFSAQFNVVVAAAPGPKHETNPTVKAAALPELLKEGLAEFPATPPSGMPVRVAVIDTGAPLAERHDGWLRDVVPPREYREDPDIAPRNGLLDWNAGHGAFVGGVVQQIAPAVQLLIYRCTYNNGLATDKAVAEAMLRAEADAASAGVSLVVNASLGAPAVDGIPPIAMRDAVELIHARGGSAVVAAAGNGTSSDPLFPAAYRGVVATGALLADGRPAPFSNYGPWVTCSTVGVGIISTFIPGRLPPMPDPAVPEYEFGPDPFAMWLGTSFAAPQISAAVARLSQDNGITPQEAVGHLLDGRPDLANYGRVLRLLPGTPTP